MSTQMPTTDPEMPFPELASQNRKKIKQLAQAVNAMHDHPQADNIFTAPPETPEPDHDEMHANITLAYRHLEDAAMRLGKAIQAFDGGVSIYDK